MTIKKPKALADYKTPWEEKGEEFDPEKGKSLFHFYHQAAWDATEGQKAADQRATDLQAQLDAKVREGESEQEKRDRELKESRDREATQSAAALDGIKYKVALEEGLTATQAVRLVGTDEKSIREDAQKLREDLGLKAPGERDDENEEEQEEDEPTPRTTPQRRLQNGGDPNPGEPTFDPYKIAEGFASRSGFRV